MGDFRIAQKRGMKVSMGSPRANNPAEHQACQGIWLAEVSERILHDSSRSALELYFPAEQAGALPASCLLPGRAAQRQQGKFGF